MERGPMALFGAIIAVGLGPAMWLGAQFGEATLTPQRPPAVTVQHNDATKPQGGSGAGDAPDQTEIVRTEPKAVTQPLRSRPKPAPSASSVSPSPSESEPTTPPTETTPPADDESQEPSTPPTESTTEPTTPPTGDDPEEPLPPDPPSGDSGTEKVAEA
ncbi:hypothetical protein AB0368_31680 [Actinoplanes sp. NPDC051475]|uniref:hypothetical protein n=1 Tax=Actinoplanes sp. NPDC051475 TaxID=3157225 RepID=UPI00344C869F